MWGVIISIILFIIGFPGLLADMEVWRYDWMMDAQWWNWALMGAGLALFLYSVVTWRSKPFLEAADSFFSASRDTVRTHLSMPQWSAEWEVKATDQNSFKLYEAACLLERSRPVWPIPSDEIERQYESLVEFTARTLRPSAFKEWEGNVHDFEIDRRRIRKYVEQRLGYDYRLPWYLKQKYDKTVPPGLDERDIRSRVLGD